MVIEISAIGAVLLALLGEVLHARRCGRIARLAFGPRMRPAPWVRGMPLLRAAAFGAVTWGLLTLIHEEPRIHTLEGSANNRPRHLILVLDVSPSMRLKDAGLEGKQTRKQRARDVLDSLFARIMINRYKVSVIATYNGAKPVVIDTTDAEVVRNILTDLPMEYAFRVGKTKLFDGIKAACLTAKAWEARSTVLVVVSDGDTVPSTGMPKLPPSIESVLVVGVGDPLAGKFIDGRQSRQDVSTLRQIAARLGGEFHNSNKKHIATATIRGLSNEAGKSKLEKLTRREYALICLVAGAAFLAILPILLHYFGTLWRPGARPITQLAANASPTGEYDAGKSVPKSGTGVGHERTAAR